ncbi:MAG: TIGR04086 family membrane protein [Clostridia bacterium]|nr:TIGR04086 family membrane protein [Clostridia bacterium]
MSEKEYGRTLVAMVKGAALGIPVCFAVMLASSFALVGANAGLWAFQTAATVSRAVGSLTAGILAAALHGKGGLLCGAGAGILLGAVLLLIGAFCYGGQLVWPAALTGSLVGLVLAAGGGILGVNLRKY